jgi:hypothetical protein
VWGPFGEVGDTNATSWGRKVSKVDSASAVSPSTSRGIAGGPEAEAPDLSKVSRAASPKARTYEMA